VQTARGSRVASNSAPVLNNSDGTAVITTGTAKALGNDAVSDGGGTVINRGFAAAVSGANRAVGNLSVNLAVARQFAAGGFATNLTTADNESNGTASVTTGAAAAIGNRSTTTISQTSDDNDDPVVDISQDIVVVNRGSAVAITGDNLATGNGSANAAGSIQRALGGLVAFNTGTAVSHSDGLASIQTGDATATGNLATTTADQSATVSPDTNPFALVDQTVTIRNIGDATAASGRNTGTGNGSANLGLTRQLAGAVAAVHSNSGPAENNSRGTSDTSTGNAEATGNSSDSSGAQGLTRAAAA
jgi:hypothetical protein